MSTYQVDWVVTIGPIEAESKYDAEIKARQLVLDGVVDIGMDEVVEQDPLEVVELDADGNPV